MSEQLSLFDMDSVLPDVKKKTKSETFYDYEGFVYKFNQEAPKTTDDCYTPENVYNVVVDYVQKNWDIQGMNIVRPFYPGGDYQHEEYFDNSIVIDNPPFSILAQILRFYCAHNIKFFLFAPALTLFSAPDLTMITYIVSNVSIEYANKAKVATGFITNLPSEYRVLVDGNLKAAISAVQYKISEKKYIWPDYVISAALLNKYVVEGVRFGLKSSELIRITRFGGHVIFGSGFLLSKEAQERIREAQERIREAQERIREAQEQRDRLRAIRPNKEDLKLINKLNNYEVDNKSCTE